jgi:ATP-dependent DNA ligase
LGPSSSPGQRPHIRRGRVERAGCKELTAPSRAVSLNWRAVPLKATKTKFIDPMLLLSSETLPEGPSWTYELKLDGYRALASWIKSCFVPR